MKRLRAGFANQDEGLTKAQRLFQAIVALIDQGIFNEGEALPPQRDIADEFQMALSVVSKVFTSLKKQGMLYGERGRGSYVAFRTRFAHDFGDRFTKDDAWLHPPLQRDTEPVLCNLISRLTFLNDPLPEKIDFTTCACPPNSPGVQSIREYGARYLRQLGMYLKPEDVIASHNAYIALWTAFRVCCPEGVVLGAPLFSFIPLFRKQMMADNVHLVPLQCDEYGVLPESLENACVTRNLNVLTCSPECELPTTTRMSKRRRMEIAEVARKHDIIIIENNWLLPTGQEPELPALAMLAPERTIFLEHGSKMLSCESFCSFSYVPEYLRSKFIYTRNITAGPLPLLIRKITQFWLDQGLVERDFNKKNAEIIFRNAMLEEIFANHPVKIHKHARFAWLPLAKNQSALAIRQKLEGANILVSASQNFLIGSSLNNEALLIGIGHEPSRSRLRNALERIRQEVEEPPST